MFKDIQLECLTCKKSFTSHKNCQSRTPKYCSKVCYAESIRKYKKCRQCGKSFADYTKKFFCSMECTQESRRGVKLSAEWRKALSEGRKKSDKCKGENLYNWKGGKSTERERIKISCHKRRSLQKTKINQDFLVRLISAQNNQCFYCECDLSKYKAIEHLTPLSRGGDNEPYNIVYSCQSCNSTKRQQTLEEFALNTGKVSLLGKFDYIYASAIY